MRTPRKRPGEFRERVIIKSVNPTTDSQGGSTEGTLQTVATMWCKVEPFSASRTLQYGQISGSQSYEITIPYNGTITFDKGNVLSWNSKDLAVHSVRMQEEDRRQWIVLAYERK